MGKPDNTDAESQKSRNSPADAGSLVPIGHHADIAEGVQAYRRGDMIFYTVRGEPEMVQELMRELNHSGIEQVVALVSHPAPKCVREALPTLDESGNVPTTRDKPTDS